MQPSFPKMRAGPSQGAPAFPLPPTFLSPRSGQRDVSNINQTTRSLLKAPLPGMQSRRLSTARGPCSLTRPSQPYLPNAPVWPASLLGIRPQGLWAHAKGALELGHGQPATWLYLGPSLARSPPPPDMLIPSLPSGLCPQSPGWGVWLPIRNGSAAVSGLVWDCPSQSPVPGTEPGT